MTTDVTCWLAGWPAGPKLDQSGDAQHSEGKEPCLDQFGKESPQAQFLLRLLPPARDWQMGSPAVPGRHFLEEILPHPAPEGGTGERVRKATSWASLKGTAVMSEKQEPQRKCAWLFSRINSFHFLANPGG